MSLAQAREHRFEARKQVAIDPSQERKAEKAALEGADNTFETLRGNGK